MLVLSRRVNEAIVLPVINTRIQVVALKGGVVRLGVDAPAAMAVYREEVWKDMQARAARGDAAPAPGECGLAPPPPLDRDLSQLVRNRLHSATLGMAQLRQQLNAGDGAQAGATLGEIETEFDSLLKQLEEVRERFAAGSAAPVAEKPRSQPTPRLRGNFRLRQPRSASKPATAPTMAE